MRFHADARRFFYGDIFGNSDGDINVVYLEPHIPIGWHRHQHQSDRLFLVLGVLRLRAFRDSPQLDGVETILTSRPGERPVVVIPAGAWHSYEALTEGTILLQFNGPGKWSGDDEERLSLAEMPWTS